MLIKVNASSPNNETPESFLLSLLTCGDESIFTNGRALYLVLDISLGPFRGIDAQKQILDRKMMKNAF